MLRNSRSKPSALSVDPAGRPWWGAALVFLGYFSFSLYIQWVTGTWTGEFTTYADEPSHFVGAAMVHDYLRSWHWMSPMHFAQEYYSRYPFFGVGYWPPLFSLTTGIWMLVFGVGRIQALMIPAICASGSASLIALFLWRRSMVVAGLLGGLLFLTSPQARLSLSCVMVDHVTAVLSLASGIFLVGYFRRPSRRDAFLFALCCAAAILSKYSALYLLGLPFAAAILLWRPELLRRWDFWIQTLLAGLLVAPWALWTYKWATYGLPVNHPAITLSRMITFFAVAPKSLPPSLLALLILGCLGLPLRWPRWKNEIVILGLLGFAQAAFAAASPVPPDPRILLTTIAVLVLFGVSGWAAALERISELSGSRAVLVVGAAAATAGSAILIVQQVRSSEKLKDTGIRASVEFVRKAAQPGDSILVPPNLEGPVIAEFVAEQGDSPATARLIRPNKLLASIKWNNEAYTSRMHNVGEVMEFFEEHPATLLMWCPCATGADFPHTQLMANMLLDYPAEWVKVGPADASVTSGWSIYKYNPPPSTKNRPRSADGEIVNPLPVPFSNPVLP